MHRTNAHWESGAIPSPELIARVGTLLGELAKAERSSARRVSAPARRACGCASPEERGPSSTVRSTGQRAGRRLQHRARRSLEEAIEWATRQASVLGDVEIDIRPVTEPWDIGMAPTPADVTTRRYMVLRKATSATEAGEAPSSAQRAALARLSDETRAAACTSSRRPCAPAARGRRYKNSRDGVSVTDGPFTETKELIGGYVIVSAASLEDAGRWAEQYTLAVQADEVDLRELE